MITVTFNGDEDIIKSDQSVYQWDTGQKVTINGLSDSSINYIHFSFKGLKTAYVVGATNTSGTITVIIPDIVLRYGKDVYMYLCIRNSNGNVVTVKTVIIPVIKRNMPENYMYDDNETVAVKLDELQTEIQRSSGVDTDHESRLVLIEEAKTNINGTTFDTLKERIDSDVNNFNNEICQTRVFLERLGYADFFDVNNLTQGYLHNGSVESDTSSNPYHYTDYIPCKYGDEIYVSIVNHTALEALEVYDENKTYIGSLTATESGRVPRHFTIPYRNAAFLRYNVMPVTFRPLSEQYLYIRSKIEYPQEKDAIEYKVIKDLLTRTWTVGTIVNANGEESSSQYVTEWGVTDYIEIPNDCTIEWGSGQTITSGNVPACCFYDADHNFLFKIHSRNQWQGDSARIKDNRVKYVRYNLVPTSKCPKKNQYLRYYISRDQELTDRVENLEKIVSNVITVSKDGTGDFSTFREATEYCWTHHNTTVLVNGGTYDLVEEYGDDYFNAIPEVYDQNHSIGPECGYNCHYIFSGGAKLIFNYVGTVVLVAGRFSPINIIGSVTFDNLVIEAQNCRYCIHEDIPTVLKPVPENVKVIYNNCHIWHKGNNIIGSYRDTCCIGAGCSPYSISTINNGTYKADNGLAAITYHHPTYADNSECTVQINGAYIDGKLQTSDYPTNKNGVLNFYVNNCSLSEEIVIASKTNATLWNNIVRT